jgi:adenylate kinase
MFGLSGVGKGWLARKLCEHRPEVLHLEASALMRATFNISSEALRTADAGALTTNQQGLVAAFTGARAAEPLRPILFDGHSVIDNDAGLVQIALEVIAGLKPQHIVFVSEVVSLIAERRRRDTRSRPIRTLDELTRHQDCARELANSYAESLAISFDEVQSRDWMIVDRLFADLPR